MRIIRIAAIVVTLGSAFAASAYLNGFGLQPLNGKVKSYKVEISFPGNKGFPKVLATGELAPDGKQIEAMQSINAIGPQASAVGYWSRLPYLDPKNWEGAAPTRPDYCTTRYKYNPNGQCVEIVTEAASGTTKHVSKVTCEYATDGTMLRQTNFENGQKSSDTTYTYDDKGNNTRTESYSDGKLVSVSTSIFSAAGRISETVTEYPQNPGDNYRNESRYDSDGNILFEGNFRADNNPNYVREYEYENGKLRKMTNLTYVHMKSNPGKSVSTYDQEGRIVSEDCWDEDGALSGRLVYKYEADGSTTQDSFDATGALTQHTESHSNKTTGETNSETFGPDGKLRCSCRTWNDGGLRRSESIAVSNGKTVVTKLAIDQNGLPIEALVVENDKVTEHVIHEVILDSKKNWTKITRYDIVGDQKPKLIGFIRRSIVYHPEPRTDH